VSNPRLYVAALTLSMAAFVGIVTSESYTDSAVIPTVNDRPTYGFGSTFDENGNPVKLGDRIKPVRAVVTAAAHITKEEAVFRTSLPGIKLHQAEYDLYMDWLYQYGSGAWQRSSMRRELIAGDYKAACDALLLYRRSGGYDCSTLIDGQPNKRCWGVWTRQLKRHADCMAAQ
jgi:lysozyme